MQQHFKIVALNELNEPFNSNNIYNTPQYVNINEYVDFFYSSTTGLTLKGNEKWVWDFDFNTPLSQKDNPIQEFLGFNTPLPTLFYRSGNRAVNVKVYDRIPKKAVKLQNHLEIDNVNKPINSIFNPITNNVLILNDLTNKITIVNTLNDSIVKTINLSANPKYITWSESHNKFYVSLDNNSVDIIDANNETITFNITLGVSGTVGEILYHPLMDNIYVIVNDTPNSNLIIIDPNSNLVSNTITISTSSKSLKILGNYLWFVNSDNNTLSKLNVISNVINLIPTSINPQQLVVDYIKNLVYVRCLNNVDICNLNVITNTVIVEPILNNSDIIVNNDLEEMYILGGTSSIIQVIDSNSFNLLPKNIQVTGINQFYYDDITNSLYTNYTIQKTPTIQENRVRVLDASDFSDHTYFITTGVTYNFYKIPNGKIYGFEYSLNKVNSFVLFPNNTNQYVDGKLLYQDTITFSIFEFPKNILGLEYALEGQTLNYTTDSIYGAEKYEWFINGIKQISTTNTLSFNFTNYVKVLIKVNITNGRITKTLNFTTSLSVGSAVIGQKYEGNIKDKLMFFNKEGDNLNFSLTENQWGDTQWEGDLIFHPNSDDTFKTIGLYILESVDAINFSTENLNLRKLQLFNEYGFDVEGGITNGTNFFIKSIDIVNKQDGFYTKWLYCDNIDKMIPIGSEIFLKDFYNVTINNSISETPIITNYSIIEDLNSYSSSGGIDLFTVIGNKRGAIMVITKTSNKNFTTNYNYGNFRQQNNNIQTIKQGQVIVLNLFKIYNADKLNEEWNEPFYKVLLYDKKKISLVNSQNNNGVFTTNYIDDDISNDLNSKYLKYKGIKISDILPDSKYDFRIKLDFKTNKIFLGNNLVDFLPASTDPFLNERNILIWESVLDKDYTPSLLKDDLKFSFEQINPNINNFNKTYTAIKVDIAKNILNPQTSDIQGWKITLNDFENISNFTFTFLINNKSNYSAKEGIDWRKGNSLNDAALSLASFLDSQSGKVIGLSVIAINNEVWIWEKAGYNFILTNFNNNIFTLNSGILKENTPEYGVIGDSWVYLNDSSVNGYVHLITNQNNFHILYVTDSGKKWYTLPTSKKVVWTEQIDKTNPNNPNSNIIDYAENLISDAYLEDTTIYFTQSGSSNIETTPEMIIHQFINSNKTTFIGYGLDVNKIDNNLVFINNFTTKTLNSYDDYVDVTFQPEYFALYGTQGTAGTPKFISSTSSFISTEIVDMINVLESVKPEKNKLIGNYAKQSSISQIWQRKILIKDIDQKTGLTLNINGIDYQVPYNNVSVVGLNNTEDTIIDVEATIENWGNQLFKLSQDITTFVDDSDIGKPYYEVLELQGVLVWLEKSEESFVNGVKHFDTIVLESKYPNVNVTYSVNGTLNNHKIIHSDIEFIEIGRELTLTINRIPYTISYNGSVTSTITAWVDEWSDTLLEQNIIVNSLDAIYDTSGLTSTIISYPKLRLGTLQEKTQLNYQIWVGKTPILGKPLYLTTSYRIGNQGIIMSGNEIRVTNTNFEEAGFATAMIMSLTNSKFALNNQEYNILFVDPNVLGLSYQGAFWNNTDITGYYIQRSNGFNWNNYKEIFLESNPTTGYFSTSGISNLLDIPSATYMEYDAFNDYMWISHNNSFNGEITIYDVADFSTKGSVLVSNNPTYMKWNPLDNNMYVSNKGSNRITVVNTNTFNIITQIPVGISPTYMTIDNYTNYLYVINEDSDDVNVINLNDFSVYATIPVGDKPTKLTLDRINRLLYIICQNSNRVYIINTIDNSLKSYVNVGSMANDILWKENSNKVYVSNSVSNNINIITYNIISDSFSVKTLITQPNPTSIQYNKDLNQIYVACNDKIIIIDSILDLLQNTIVVNSNIGMIKYIPFANAIFYTMPTINNVGLFHINDEFYQITNLPVGDIPSYITYSTNNVVFVANSGTNFVSLLKEVPFQQSSSGTSGNTQLSLSTRNFLRYPRERFIDEDPIYFKMSWVDDNDTSMFFYDFTGKQLYIEMKNKNGVSKRINDNGVFNYNGITPLIINNDNSFLNTLPNKNISEIDNPKVQQTIFDNIYHDLDFIDSETDLDPRPFPMQLFIGYNSKNEGVNERSLLIERMENISLTILTKLKDETNPSLGYIDILEFDSENNEIKTINSKINFIEAGFKVGQIVEFSGLDTSNTKNEATFNNAGYLGKITKVFVNRIIFTSLNKNMKSESTLTQTYSLLPPFRVKSATLQIKMVVKPSTIAKIKLKGQTEIEDERFKVVLNNFGYNINHRDIFIFKEYDIKEAGIDWIFLNQKRKEMLINYPEIFNYLGSYKALINAVNYFGYNDLELYEYYLNIDKKSDHYGKLHKIEIPDIFDNSVDGYTPKDFIIKSLPNKRYQKTRLFNLTYRITDLEGNYILGYSLDEVITKLLGLKRWLRENIMPIGTRISDLTGRGDTVATTTLWHDVKQSKKITINESLTPVDFRVEAYLQPVINYSKTYNVHVEFFTQGNIDLSDYYHVNIYTFSALPNYNDTNFKLRCVQNLSYYKTDLSSINFTSDLNTDPYILIEVICDNGFGATYNNKKSFIVNSIVNI